MEASAGPRSLPTSQSEPNTEKIKQKLLKKGVYPTPKIIHTLRKKELHKSLRLSKAAQTPPLTGSQDQAIAEEAHFQTLKAEYKTFTKAINAKTRDKDGVSMIGKPWERMERIELRELASASNEYGGDKLKSEHLRELSDILENEREKFRWILEDDIEIEEGWFEKERGNWAPPKRRGGDAETIQFLVNKLSGKELSVKDWKFSRMMKQSGLQFTEGQLLRIVGGLGDRGQWRHALSVVEWVYSSKEHRHYKSRFVYTKVLAVLGKARKPHEALKIFSLMRGDCHIYPDMPAYHSIAVALGQAGLLKDLLNVIECMKQKPSRKIKNMRRKNWDPVLQPDVVIFNAVLNACVTSHQWRGVSWVFEQLRKSGLKPNGASYGLAMEVMLQSGKYDLVHEYFGKMKRSGEAPKALTYKVLVKALWAEGKINEAVQAVRDMEQRGVVGTACVYYELACCLCNNGRWQEAMLEVEKLKKLPRTKPMEVTFTGMILSSMDGGYVDDCVFIFEHSKEHCASDIGIINAMLNVYGRNDMFLKAKKLFEDTKRAHFGSNICQDDNGSSPNLDAYTYSSMLKASASALQWEYFEYVYKEMVLSGYQLDQSKHASLLVEASRAGKLNLLEHAFDTILEAGEVPYPSFFTEMICQATVQEDYERAITIVNTLAHAPFQVSEKHWIDLFKENGDRISKSSLKKLFDTLNKHDLSQEASVSNLSRSLQSLCGSCNTPDCSNSTALGNDSLGESSPLDGYNRGFEAEGSVNTQNFQVNGDDALDTLSVNRTNNRDGRASLCSNMECFADDLASNESADFLQYRNSKCIELVNLDDDDDDNELELDMSTSEVDDYRRSDLPSAFEILESWKESMRKDGIFFPFQLDGK